MSIRSTIQQLKEFASDCFGRAELTANKRRLPKGPTKLARNPVFMSFSAASVMESHGGGGLTEVEHFDGMRAWGAFLTYDLRKSSRRAVRIGPRDTFVTMHTYMPVVLRVIEESGGRVVGLRGDGAVAMFGVVEDPDGNKVCTDEENKNMARRSCLAGEAVVRAVQTAVNPVLVKGKVEGGLIVGVGIDIGEFVATRIGIEKAQEFTAYGECVNNSSHLSESGNDSVVVSRKVMLCYPKTKGGKTLFPEVPTRLGSFFFRYPPELSPFADK